MTPNEFVRTYRRAAEECEKSYGVPATVTLAQAALESGWGNKATGNNFFGVKADGSWKGKAVIVRTHEYEHGKRVCRNLSFRAYATAAESFADHGKFLRDNPRYAPCFACGDNASRWCDALQTCGYATDPSYSRTLRMVLDSVRSRL